VICGYLREKWVRKPLAFLQAYIDDSSSDTGDQRLFMAGYLNSAGDWRLFSEAWSEELKSEPTIDYLHMVEANNLRGQFKGWTIGARDLKLAGLVRVIRHFRPISFEFSVSREKYFSLVKPVSPHVTGNPHFICCFGIVSTLSRYLENSKINIPIDFIFDKQQGVSADILLFFDYMKKNIPRKARKNISGIPVFMDDRLVLPLQAADMLAWHVRREHERCVSPDTLPMADLLRNEGMHISSAIDEKMLMKWADEFSKMPAIQSLSGKASWKEMRSLITRLSSAGFVPPYGTRWKNLVFAGRERLSRFFQRK
jgi:hypothetical protein